MLRMTVVGVLCAVMLVFAGCGAAGEKVATHSEGTFEPVVVMDADDGASSAGESRGAAESTAEPRGAAESTAEPTQAGLSDEELAAEARALPAGMELSDDDIARYGTDALFTSNEIDDALFERIYGLSYKDYCTVPREDLRYLKVLHRDADGRALVGELMVNASVADDVLDIFRELYEAGYPIEKMHLVDDYGADDDASMEDDNTSAFNYRLIAGTDEISNHAYGLAIDINPFYNPYCIPSQDYVSPTSAYEYGNRDASFPYKIERGDLCYTLFTEHGFTWGGDWDEIKDYQHFEK